MKKFVALVLAILTVLALCVPAFAAKVEKPIAALTDAVAVATTAQEITGARVNVRSAASTASAKLGSLVKGDIVAVIEIADGWAKILWNGSVAYVSADFVTLPAAQTVVNGEVAKTAEQPL